MINREKEPKKQNENRKKKSSFKERIKGDFNKKYIKNGSYSIALCAVFTAIILMINLIVNALPSKYSEIDVSAQKLFSIGSQTEKFLKNLNKDVTIYLVAANGSEDETLKKLLQKYEDASSHITVKQKDPIVNPKFTTEYTDEPLTSNSLIVECGDRNKIIDYKNIYETAIDYNTYSYNTTGFDGEGQITSAISYVTSENLPVLYTLDGHGEKDIDPTIREDIEKGNIEIRSLNLLTEKSVPEDAACLMINSPASDISVEEKDAILAYLENGGKSMIFSDHTDNSLDNFDMILENYGVERAEGIVIEGNAQHYAMQMPYYLVPNVKNAEPITDFVSDGYFVLAPYAQGIRKLEDVRDTVQIESLLTTSDSAYSKVNIKSETLEKTKEDIAGPFDVGVSITEKTGDDKTTQIIYYSTSNLMDSQINQAVAGGNEKMIMESLNWMCSTEENASVSIPSKSLEIARLTLTAYDASFWKICVIGLIPGIFLVIGFSVWLKRRKA